MLAHDLSSFVNSDFLSVEDFCCKINSDLNIYHHFSFETFLVTQAFLSCTFIIQQQEMTLGNISDISDMVEKRLGLIKSSNRRKGPNHTAESKSCALRSSLL